MVSTRVKSQPKSSPQTGSAVSTPKTGRRLTPATPTSRQSSKATKTKAKAPTRVSKRSSPEDDDALTPSEDSSSSDDNSGDAFDPDSSASEEELVEDEEESEVDSDFLDEDEDDKSKRKSTSTGRVSGMKKSRPSSSKVAQAESEEEEEAVSDVELEDGQVIAGRIYPAPTTGQGKSRFLSTRIPLNLSPTRSNLAEYIQISQEPADTRAK